MSVHLNHQQTRDWIEAVGAVEQIAASTDNMSGSKGFLDDLVDFVRDEPGDVTRLLALT